MKRSLVAVVVFFIFALGLFLIPGSGHAQEKVITLKVAHFFPSTSRQGVAFQQWAKDLEKRTDGKVKVNVYPGSTLAATAQTYDAVVKGIADVGNHVLGYTMGRFPFFEGIDLPFGYPAGSAVTKMVNAFYTKFQPKEVEQVKILWFHSPLGAVIHMKTKPINRLEDLKGVRMRTFGSNAKFMANLGGTPIATPITELYEAVSKGVVEGFMGGYGGVADFKFENLVNYTTENHWSSYTSVFMVCMNKNKFNSLPKDIQATIDQISKEYIEKFTKLWVDDYNAGKELLIKKGTKIITLSKEEEQKFADKAKPLIEEYAANVEAKGLPGKEAVKFIQDYLKPYKQ